MDEVVLALEGSLAPMECFVDDRSDDGRVLCSHHDDSGRGCATKLLWTRVQVGVLKTLAHTTLAELIEFQTRQLPRVGVPAANEHQTPAPA
jgi:DNA-binding IscR family transcriptional regulator